MRRSVESVLAAKAVDCGCTTCRSGNRLAFNNQCHRLQDMSASAMHAGMKTLVLSSIVGLYRETDSTCQPKCDTRQRLHGSCMHLTDPIETYALNSGHFSLVKANRLPPVN